MPGIEPLRRDAARLAMLRPAQLFDLARAAMELAIARLRLNSRGVKAWIAAGPSTGPAAPLDARQRAVAERIAFAVPRAADRLPWRADCLVQAIAARRWLDRKGVPSALFLGVARDRPVEFGAHAWLKAGERVVTGGDIADFVAFRP